MKEWIINDVTIYIRKYSYLNSLYISFDFFNLQIKRPIASRIICLYYSSKFSQNIKNFLQLFCCFFCSIFTHNAYLAFFLRNFDIVSVLLLHIHQFFFNLFLGQVAIHLFNDIPIHVPVIFIILHIEFLLSFNPFSYYQKSNCTFCWKLFI